MSKIPVITKQEKIMFNFFLIRETYHYMAKVDNIPNATQRLYNFLETTSDRYDQLVKVGAGDISIIKKHLISCGYSDVLFRTDAPSLIKVSEDFHNDICEYLFNKNMSLSEFREVLTAHIGFIRNTDNTLLVVSTRRLIDAVMKNSSPDDTLLDFISLLDDVEYSGHHLQKNLEKDIVNIYEKYIEKLDEVQNEKTNESQNNN